MSSSRIAPSSTAVGACPAPAPVPAWAVALAVPAGAVLIGGASVLGPVAVLGLGLAGGLALVLLARPALAVLVVVAVAPVISGVRRDVPVPGLRLTEVLILGVLGAILALGWSGWRPRWTGIEWATLGYVAATVVLSATGAAWQGSGLDIATVAVLLAPIQFLLLSRTISITLLSEWLRRSALRAVLLASVPVSMITVLQYLDVGSVLPWTSAITGHENVQHAVSLGFAVRATGPFDHWHVLAGYLLPVVLVAVALLLDDTQRVMSRPALWATLGASLVALTMTFTFTAMFGLVAGILVLGLLAGRLGSIARWGVIVALPIVALLGPYMSERVEEQFRPRAGDDRPALLPETIDYRFQVWQEEYLPAVAESPVLGYGPELPDTITWGYSESMYLSLQLRGGVLLVLTFAVLVWAFLAVMAAPARSPDATVRIPAQVVIAVTVVLIPMHATFPYFASPGMPHVIWVLAGIALAGRWQAERTTSGRPTPNTTTTEEMSR